MLRVWQVIAGGWERQVFVWEDEEDKCVSNHRTLQAHKYAAQETPGLSALCTLARSCLLARQLPARQSFNSVALLRDDILCMAVLHEEHGRCLLATGDYAGDSAHTHPTFAALTYPTPVSMS